jgi:hypothetical protein
VLPFGVSRHLFRYLVMSARMKRFQHVSRLALARSRRLPLEDDLIAEVNELAVEAILGLLIDGRHCEASRADATGERNLAMSEKLRRLLASQVRSGKLTEIEAHQLVGESRESFRRAIHGTLVLPARVAKIASA